MNEPTDTRVPVAGEPVSSASTQDAVALLRADHSRIEALLDDAVRLAGDDLISHADRSGSVSRLGAVLIAHVRMEAELLSPAIHSGDVPAVSVPSASSPASTATPASPATPESASSPANARHDELLDKLQALVAAEGADAEVYKAALAQMQLTVRAHIDAQETKLLPQLQSGTIDLVALGAQMAVRRGALLGMQGVD